MQMTITEALKELKTLDARIDKAVSQPVFVAVAIGGKMASALGAEEVFKAKAEAGLKSAQALIARRSKIKELIVESNAATKVTVAGAEYTVAGAIERKKSIAYEQRLSKYVGLQYLRATREADEHNNRQRVQLDQHITTILGKDAKDKGGTEVDEFSKNYLAKNEAKLVDPIGALAFSTLSEEKTDAFLAQIDTKLSIINATTMIEVAD